VYGCYAQLAILVMIIPGWLWLILAPSVLAGFVTLAVWGFIGGIFLASPYLWTAEVFPTQIRSSGFMAYNLSVCVFGGCGPLICAALVQSWSKVGTYMHSRFRWRHRLSIIVEVLFPERIRGIAFHRNDMFLS
jgi:MFS family permease